MPGAGRKALSAGVKDKAGTECYALDWTHHTVGSQNIRVMPIIQRLFGKMGTADGFEPCIQASARRDCHVPVGAYLFEGAGIKVV